MTREEAINVLENEKKCVLRDSCERSECASCDLVMPIERIKESLRKEMEG